MINIIFEKQFQHEQKNIVFHTEKNTITWKSLFYFISKKINIHPYFIRLDIGKNMYYGDRIKLLPPFKHNLFNQCNHLSIKVFIRIKLINNMKKEMHMRLKKIKYLMDNHIDPFNESIGYIRCVNLLYPY